MSTADTPKRQVSPALLIGLGVVAAIAVGFLAVMLLSGGDDDLAADGSGPVAIASEPATVATEPAASEDPSEVVDNDAVEQTFEVFDARDPFDQLVADDTTGAGAADDTVGTTQPATSTTPTDGATPVDGTQPTGATPPAPAGPGPSQTTVGATTILLDDVFTQGGVETAVVVVDDEGYEAREGDTVAGKVTVLDIAGSCATMRFEDKRFILCEGEQIQK